MLQESIDMNPLTRVAINVSTLSEENQYYLSLISKYLLACVTSQQVPVSMCHKSASTCRTLSLVSKYLSGMCH